MMMMNSVVKFLLIVKICDFIPFLNNSFISNDSNSTEIIRSVAHVEYRSPCTGIS